MIARILILVAGLLLAALTALLWKKLPAPWRASLLAGALLVAGIGGAFTWGLWRQQQSDRESVYLALRYLQYSDPASAAYHLKKVSDDTFDSLCAESLLETMRGNDVLARMKLDGASAKVKKDAQEAVTIQLATLGADEQSRQAAVQTLLGTLALSEKAAARADARFVAESGYYLESAALDDAALWEGEEAQRQQVSRALSSGDYGSALYTAAELVEQKASAQNRLLLAEAVAEAAYSGWDTGWVFAPEDGSMDREAAALQARLDEAAQQAAENELLLSAAADEAEIQRLTDRQAELAARQQSLQQQWDTLYVRRALNSIADLHSLDARIVRARLYFAMNDYAGAAECLQKAGGSLAARLTTDTALRSALQLLRESSADDQTLGGGSAEFRSAMDTVLTAGAMDYVGISTTPLTENFITYLVSGQKRYGRDLYVTGIDLTAYPQVTVSLSGRDTLVEKLLQGRELTVRDTRQDVAYTIEAVEQADARRSVVCIVDESGSMLGPPLRDAQSALTGFLSALDDGLDVALVSFDDTARLRTGMGEGKAAALAAVDQIGSGGGTEITAGIRLAMEAAAGSAGSTTALLMTDGQSAIDMDVVQQAARSGMIIHTIGFGSVDDDVLQGIADATGGQYIRADSSSELISVYFSLVGMLGNQIRVRYTAPEAPADTPRYFFLRDEAENVSVRVDYALPETAGPQLTGVSRTRFSPDELSYAQESGGTLSLALYGTGLQDVQTVTVGGLPAALTDRYEDSELVVELPLQLQPGWQTIALTDADGAVYEFEHLLVVGETVACRTFHYGGVRILCQEAVLLEDGTLILIDGQLDDQTGTDGQTVRTLAMQFEGTLCASVDYAAFTADVAYLEAQGGPVEANLDTAAPLAGMGTVRLQGGDSGYDYSAPDTVAAGSYLLQYENGQVRLIQQ